MSVLEQIDPTNVGGERDALVRAEEFHDRAMDLVDQAVVSRVRGDGTGEQEYLRQAFKLERAAADVIAPYEVIEPSRSILHRSAATLALRIGDISVAARLAHRGLSGYPPSNLEEELKEVLEEAELKQHLHLKGTKLSSRQVQLVLDGGSTSSGVIDSKELLPRIGTFGKLVQRTGERLCRLPFEVPIDSPSIAQGALPQNGHIRSSNKLQRPRYPVFVGSPRAGSFAVTIQVGSPEQDQQLQIPGIVDEPIAEGQAVVEEVFNCLDLYRNAKSEELRNRIGDELYLRNFVHLARQMAADGRNIKLVGLTLLRDDKELSVPLAMAPPTRLFLAPDDSQSKALPVTIVGVLKAADAAKPLLNKIAVIDDQSIRHTITVPDDLMRDIVKPLWDERVSVECKQHRGKLYLEDIVRISDLMPRENTGKSVTIT